MRCKRSAAVSGTLLVQPREKGIECPAPAPLGEECPSPTTHPAALTVREEIGENAFLYAGGGVAQLGEHHVRNVGVGSSILLSSTTFPLNAHSTRLAASSCVVPLRLPRNMARTGEWDCHPIIFFDAGNGGTSGSTSRSRSVPSSEGGASFGKA